MNPQAGPPAIVPGFSELDPARVARWFGGAAALLVAIHLVLHAIQRWGGGMDRLILDRFDLDVEQSVPTWFSAASLLICSGLLALIARNRRGERYARHWQGLALILLSLSADEIAALHEVVNTISATAWVVSGGLFVLLLGLAYLRFLGELPRRTRTLFICAGAIYFGGALGIEQALLLFRGAPDLESFRYAVWTAVEEGAEMGGTVVLLYALLDFLQRASRAAKRAGPADAAAGP